jgi:hypothetical protein
MGAGTALKMPKRGGCRFGAIEICRHVFPFPFLRPPHWGLDGEGLSGREPSKRKGEGSEGDHPLARSAAKESGETEPEGVALALEREVRR